MDERLSIEGASDASGSWPAAGSVVRPTSEGMGRPAKATTVSIVEIGTE